jgi:rubredoxin
MSEFRKYVCVVCGHVYDEAEGDPDGGISAGTRWGDVPDEWACSECGATKADFEPA